MPDATLADGHLSVAKRLANLRRPKQCELRRSISASYYAVFHALARTCANALVGKSPANRPQKAWVEVYRGLNHGTCIQSCKEAHKVGFPSELIEFAGNFIQLQDLRHSADYDPDVKFTKSDAVTTAATAELAITTLRALRPVDKRAFAAWVLITSQGAKKARDASKRAQSGT